MRSLIALLVGVFMGGMLTVVALNSLRKGTAYPNGLMAVMTAQMGQLDEQVKAKSCNAEALAPNLATLAALGNDIEPAFMPTGDDARFSSLAGDYRAAVGLAISAASADCEAASTALNAISVTCKACHQEFKN